MKGILHLCKVFIQSLNMHGIEVFPEPSFRITLLDKYPSAAVLKTIDEFTRTKGWVWSGKYAWIAGDHKEYWEIIMYTASGFYRNVGILDNGQLESVFYLKEEVCKKQPTNTHSLYQ